MSRFDSIGLFWQDLPSSRKRGEIDRPRPPVPETGWKAPAEFPNLSSAVVLSIDTETKDPELDNSGPGWARNAGHVVGFSVGAKDRQGNYGSWYWPIRHEDTPEENCDPEKCLAWLGEQMARPLPKVGANLIYDIGWLRHEGIRTTGPLFDVQYAEALLDEASLVDLDTLAHRYLDRSKEGSLLYQWCADFYGGNPTDRQRKNIYRSPPSLVGPYGEADADLPLRIIDCQWPKLAQEGLLDLFHMECELIPLMVDMRYEGVAVDLPRTEEMYDALGAEVDQLQAELAAQVGFQCNVNSGDDLARAFRAEGIPFKMTAPSASFPEGKPSFTASFLEGVEHPMAKAVVEIRQREKLRGTFLKSYILDNAVNGKVHGSFNQLRGEGGGTRSGRFSSDSPNLQNIPIRSELGKRIRRLFIPDEGHIAWRKYDYSQIEYRFLAHFAVGPGADELRRVYNEEPDTDYHKHVHSLILKETGIDLIRGHVKNTNFGLVYGMGGREMARQLGITLQASKELFGHYHKGAPYVKPTMKATMAEAQTYGVITTIMGRKSRFDLWEPSAWGVKKPGLSRELALSRYGQIKRAYTHKALNRRLQGSAADQMKTAMHQCYTSGVFDATGIPRLTVHDELDFSDAGGCDEAFREMQHIMETCIQLRVPVKADYEVGPNWGDVITPS